MRYVDVDGVAGELTGVLDPGPCLARLPELAPRLPPGARAFATDPGHYDFSGRRCVKDLAPVTVRRCGDGELELRFRHNCWKHDEDLVVRYEGVRDVRVAVRVDVPDGGGAGGEGAGGASGDGVARLVSDGVAELGDVVLDEVLPHSEGCAHEIACRGGTLVVTCRRPGWTPAAPRTGDPDPGAWRGRGGRGLGWPGDDPGS